MLLQFTRQVMPATADPDDLAPRPPQRKAAHPDRPRTALGLELMTEGLGLAAPLDFLHLLLQAQGGTQRQQAVQRHHAGLVRVIALAQPKAGGRVGIDLMALRIESLPGIRRLLEQALLQRAQQLDGDVLPLKQHGMSARRVRHGLQPGRARHLRRRAGTQVQPLEPAHLAWQGQPQILEQAAAVCAAQAVEQAVGQCRHGQFLGHLQPVTRLCVGTQDAAGTAEQQRRQRHGLEQQTIQADNAGLPIWTLIGRSGLLLQQAQGITAARTHPASRISTRACSKSNCWMASSSWP